MLDRHADCLDHMPRQVAADGGFASRDTLSYDKENQIKDAVFAKKHGLPIMEMAKSAWGYKMLHNFRASMEAGIPTLKRAFGLDRCTWSRDGRDSGALYGAASHHTTCWLWPGSNWRRHENNRQ